MIVDLGTGDGRAVLVAAAAEPRALVLGVDADAASMAEVSRRATRPERKGGRPNALFLASGVEALDPVFDRCADLVTVIFPWGSLLRGALALDEADAVSHAMARLPKRDGQVEMLLSVTPRDGLPALACLDEVALAGVAARWAAYGLCLVEAHPATAAELAATSSPWAKRLRAGGSDREAWRLVLRRLP